jgi:hypothetical protein
VALVSREAYRRIAAEYQLSETSLRRHAKEHLPALLSKARAAVELADADDLLSRLEALHSRTLAVLEAVEGTENHSVALGAIREARSNLELIGRVTKELDSGTTLNLYLSPQWLSLRALIVGALEGHSEARNAVLVAIEEASSARS